MHDDQFLPAELDNHLQQFRNFLQRNLGTFLYGNGNSLDASNEDFEAILHLMALIKDPGFEEENEFRLCVFEAPNPYLPKEQRVYPKLREKLASYLEFPLNLEETLEQIIIGPQEDMPKKKEFLEKYLEPKGLENVLVRESEIPYRPRKIF